MMRLLLFNILLAVSVWVNAQHYQFSQFYAAQTYLNPAFTGAGACARLSMNYRNQWSLIPGTFTSYQVAYDRPLREYNSGLGVLFFNDKAGLGNLKTTVFNLQYAYELRINKSLTTRAGISTGYTQRSIDYSALTFGDQIARGGAASTIEDISTVRTVYFDLNMGYLIFSQKWWAGASFNHLTRPNQSLQNGTSRLPMEIKVHGGYKYMIEEDASNAKEQHNVTAAINYKKQNKFNEIDIGGYYTKGYLVLGMWYRGIPLYKPYNWYSSRDALIFLVGMSADKIQVGYSFDYTVSKLTVNNTRGTHEISMTFNICNSKKKRKKKTILISCPKF